MLKFYFASLCLAISFSSFSQSTDTKSTDTNYDVITKDNFSYHLSKIKGKGSNEHTNIITHEVSIYNKTSQSGVWKEIKDPYKKEEIIGTSK